MPTVDAPAADRETGPVTKIFTFGYAHVCPFTGESLAEHYATVVAPDTSAARLLMNAAYDHRWAHCYDPDDPRIARHLPRMTEHAHLVIAVPDPSGLGYSREPDDPTPVSPARVPLHTGVVVDGGRLVTDEP